MSIGESIHIPDRLCWSCELIRRGMGAGGTGGRPFRWSVFRRRRGTSPSPTLGRAGGTGMGAGGGVPGLPRPVVGVSPAAGDKRQPYIRTAAAAGRLGMSAGGAGFRPSHVRWSVFRRRRGTSPSPTLGRRRCRRRRGMSAGGAGFRPSHVRWSVFRRRRGTSPSPTLGRRRCAGGAGFRPSHVGRGLNRRRVWAPVVGVSPAVAGFRPSHVRWSVFRRRRGDIRTAVALH